jgi:hypothetical protein
MPAAWPTLKRCKRPNIVLVNTAFSTWAKSAKSILFRKEFLLAVPS